MTHRPDVFDPARWLDNQSPNYAVATINLIDALRDYVHSADDQGKDLLDDGQITRAEYDAWMFGPERKAYCDLRAGLERDEIAPDLGGLIEIGKARP